MGLMIELAVLLCACPLAFDFEAGVALDGARSFGEVEPRDIEKMFRSASDDAALLLVELHELQSDVDLLVRETLKDYERRGLFSLVEDGPDLVDLHRRFDALEASPFVRPLEPVAAQALVAMLVDARFRVRRHVLAHVVGEQRELAGVMALFQAHSRGVAGLEPSDIDRLARRADLAAVVLRAIRADLRLLRDPEAPAALRNPDAMQKLTASLVEGDRLARSFYDQWNVRWRGLGQRMLLDLRTTRLEPLVRKQRAQRDEGLRRAKTLYREVLVLLPYTPQGQAARRDVLEMSKADRHRLAIHTGLEALRLDPFAADLSFAVAEAYDFLQGNPFSRLYFDRFLALRGIRSYDYTTIRDRDLSAAEERALSVVSAWVAETQPGILPGTGH
ncbi:MAG: hypothetical protein ACI8QZ_003648 [Chlamydiales bacterium]|jgi:hypothetical protein